jgi:hypothetical protein
MKTQRTSIEGHLNMVRQHLEMQIPAVHRLEQVEIVARTIARTYDKGCSFEDLDPLISALNIALNMMEKK